VVVRSQLPPFQEISIWRREQLSRKPGKGATCDRAPKRIKFKSYYRRARAVHTRWLSQVGFQRWR
jgi:hypothetical protein